MGPKGLVGELSQWAVERQGTTQLRDSRAWAMGGKVLPVTDAGSEGHILIGGKGTSESH